MGSFGFDIHDDSFGIGRAFESYGGKYHVQENTFAAAADAQARKEESRQQTTRIAYITAGVIAAVVVAIIIFRR